MINELFVFLDSERRRRTHHPGVCSVRYLCDPLMSGGRRFGDSGDDFSGGSGTHHLGGEDGDWTVPTCRGRSLSQSGTT